MGRLSQGQKRSAAAACRDRREPGKRLARSTARQAQPQGRPARRVQRASAARPGQAGRRPGRLLGTVVRVAHPVKRYRVVHLYTVNFMV